MALEFLNQGKLNEAEKIYRDLIEKGTKNHISYGNLAIICRIKGDIDDTIRLLKKSIEIEPLYEQAYNNLGVTLREKNDFDNAIKFFEKAIEIKPDYSDAYLNLGIIMHKKNKLDAAKNYYRKAIETNPLNINAFNSLGIIYASENKLAKAILFYKEAIEINPLCSEIHMNLANSLLKQGKIDEAIISYKKSININPQNANSHNNLGSALKMKGLVNDALCEYNNAIKIEPKYANAYFNLGVLLDEMDKEQAAIKAYKESIKIDPSFVEAHTNLGIIYQNQGSLNLAINSYEMALRYDPKNSKTRWNLSITQLLAGNYKDGWRNYEWRLNNINSNKLHSSPKTQPIFDDIIKLKENLLVISEQGLGDTMQYMRYVPFLRELGLNVYFSAQEKLHNLIKVSNIDSDPLTPQEAESVKDRRWIPLLSVPKNLGVTPNNPVINKPYIKTKKELLNKWKQKLSHENKPIVGINWQGSLDMEKDSYKGRSIPLENFSILLDQNDITFLSLQKGYGSDQVKDCSFADKFVSCQNEIDLIWDFAENAAIAANCDLIITCDTSVAHLAGGMGLKVWLLLKNVPFWTWGLCGQTTFWYPSMRLFRQDISNDWITLLKKVRLELNNELNYFNC